jgi:hypothetical protein
MSGDKPGVVFDAMVFLQATANEGRDEDLLDLMTGHTTECKEFPRRFGPLKVIGPVEFLKSLALENS